MKRWWWAIGAAVIVVAGVVLVWFQPQKLFIDDTVTEAAPTVRPAVRPIKRAAEPTAPITGEFESLAHETVGRAVVLETSDETRTLRLEAFKTSNGPDLFVYLSTGEPYGEDFVDLGRQKGNVGDQNYSNPTGTDLDRYDTAVVWCRRFTVAFGAATLT